MPATPRGKGVFHIAMPAVPRSTLAVLLACACALVAGAPARADEGDVLVRFKPGVAAASRAEARRRADVRREASLAVAALERVDPEPGVSARAAADALARDADVLYAEPDRTRSAAMRADDPLIAYQWGLARIDVPDAWDVTTGSRDVLVAVVDSGVDLEHPDLTPNLVGGWDYVDGDALPDDESDVGHGTHVAGTIGARGDDGVGVSGVAWSMRLMPLRILDRAGNGSVSDEIDAFARAAASGARVVNASFGGAGFSQAERDAIAAATGVLFVAAAGNDGADDDAAPVYPCAYDLPNVICVTASDRDDGRPGYANVGARSVDLAAPGDHIASTLPGGRWGWLSGTSMAAPHVAGAAALLLSHEPRARPADLVAALDGTAAPLTAFAGRTVSGGRLDAAAALAAVRATTAPAVAAAPARGRPAPPAAATWPAPGVTAIGPAPHPADPPAPAKLKVRRAAVRRGRLDVLAEITRRASGPVQVVFRSHGRTARFAEPIRDGRVRFTRHLAGRQRRGSGIVSLRWRGDAAVRAASVRLRAADQPARLRVGEAAVRRGQLVADGTVSPRARGLVHLRLAYPATGALQVASFSARIDRGRWHLTARLPPAAGEGSYLTVQFTGYRRARGGAMRGEQDARQIASG